MITKYPSDLDYAKDNALAYKYENKEKYKGLDVYINRHVNFEMFTNKKNYWYEYSNICNSSTVAILRCIDNEVIDVDANNPAVFNNKSYRIVSSKINSMKR